MHVPLFLIESTTKSIATSTSFLTTTATTGIMYQSEKLNEASEYLHFIKANYGSLLIILAVVILLFVMYFTLVLNDHFIFNKIMSLMRCTKGIVV